MANIKLTSLEQKNFSAKTVNKNYYFTDVDMDIHQSRQHFLDKIWTKRNDENSEKGKDIAVIHDIAAIKNSLFYILTTIPGQRPLVPNFGCDIRRYIAEPITQHTANNIAYEIRMAIGKWEPRVRLTSLTVTPNEDENEYLVEIDIVVPKFSTTTTVLKGKITQQSFTFLKD